MAQGIIKDGIQALAGPNKNTWRAKDPVNVGGAAFLSEQRG